ncbi:hypothetical protein [Chryseobacterium sp. 'Rf worker isolate 10']|uniref:hypothetical protein n=1 Tax=Chryseobacterium sp. 'Rf worker isolate 10' TaxID=2887348 RepID=UPI003D6DEA73
MKKKLIILTAISFSILGFSQVGINTTNPQGTLHVDGAKDNPATGAPTAAQQLNDFTVTNTGNVGVGKTVPTEKIDVVGNVQFSGTLKPNGNAGTSGQILTSQGNASSPTWVTSNVVPVVATVKSAEAMSFPNNSAQKLKFDQIEQNTWGGVDTTNDQITVNQDGDYLIQAQLGFPGGSITNNGVVIYIYKGSTQIQVMQAPAAVANNTLVNIVGVHHLVSGDIITIQGQQSNGNTVSWNPAFFRFSIAKL